jgi:hypothetical protein
VLAQAVAQPLQAFSHGLEFFFAHARTLRDEYAPAKLKLCFTEGSKGKIPAAGPGAEVEMGEAARSPTRAGGGDKQNYPYKNVRERAALFCR